jgi:hypothetical protein
VPLLLIPILELVILLVGLGLAAHARGVSGGLVNWLKGVAESSLLLGLAAAHAVKLDQWLTHYIGEATASVTRRVVQWFGALNHYQDVVGYWSLYWPVGLYHTTRHLVERVMPHAITARTAPLSTRIDATEAQAKALAGELHSFPKVAKAHDHVGTITEIQTVAMPHAGEWDWIHRHWESLQKAVTGAAAAAVAGTLPHAPAWPHPWRGIRTELGKMWRFRNYVLSATGAAAIVAAAIGGISSSCVRKGNIAKTARRICGLDTHLLDTLLLDGLAIIGAVSVVEFAEALVAIEDEALKVMSGLIQEWPS